MASQLRENWGEVERQDIVDTLGRVEDVGNRRLTLMLVFVGIVVGFATEAIGWAGNLLLAWGAGICWMLTLAIWRAGCVLFLVEIQDERLHE